MLPIQRNIKKLNAFIPLEVIGMATRNAIFRNCFVFGVLLFCTTADVFALTASGTSITNSATVNYDVNSIPQTAKESNTAAFVVDNKVDLTVTTNDGAIVQVTPGATAQVLTYVVKNTGNTIQDFSLTAPDAAAGAFAETETFNATNVHIFVESGAHVGYLDTEDTATYIDQLAAGAEIKVYVVANIPLAQIDADVSSFDLVAQVAAGTTTGSKGADITSDDVGTADNSTTIQIVFADGAGSADAAKDGKHSSRDGYKCVSSKLTIAKTTTVISDPFSSSNPKAIPGAVVEHVITVSNGAGGADATNITITDDLTAQDANIAFLATGYAADSGINVTAPIIGNNINLTNASDSDEGSFGSNTVTVTGITLTAGQSAIVKFKVTIK
ncbi:MAG: hypothetical protein WCU00_04335 [Candidatus Latescibacterota bacterium]